MEYQPPEAPAPVSSPAVIPWEEPGPPWPQRLIATLQLLFTRPREAFERMPLDSELLKPFLFALIVGSVGWVAHLFWETLTRGALRGLMPGNMQAQRFEMPLALVPFVALFSPAIVAVCLLITAAIDHLFLLIVGGAKQGFNATLRATCYALGSQVLLLLPLCGTLLALIAGIAFTIVGFSAAHRISIARSALAVLLPICFCCVCLVIALVTVGSALFAHFGSGGWK